MKVHHSYFTFTIMKLLSGLIIVAFSVGTLTAQNEICNNGIDDDNDGLIDLNDENCACRIVEVISLIANPSFEDQDCCPSERSELNCASGWIQASRPTTDFIHTCDWLGWDQFPPPRPFPDGEGIMGFRDGRVRAMDPEPFWKEYAGACLINPLQKDSAYRFQFDIGFVDELNSPPIDISFFGTADCVNLPFGGNDETFGCPSNDPTWVKLGEVRADGGDGDVWLRKVVDIIPDMDINAIAIGPDCDPVPSEVSIYYFFDNLLLTDIASFSLQMTAEEHPCSEDFTISVPFNGDVDYQWYKDGIALVDETQSDLSQVYGEGIYQVRIDDGIDCRLSAEFEYEIPSIFSQQSTSICDGDVLPFGSSLLDNPGVYLDTLKNANNCDSIIELDLRVIGASYDTIAAKLFEGQVYEVGPFAFDQAGTFPVTLTSSIGCDSLVLIKLDYFGIMIPNVVSTSAQSPNNTFKPFSQDGNIEAVDIRIYDRWGNLIFRGEEWNGRDSLPGVYVYAMEITFIEGAPSCFYGDITLLD